MIALLGIGPGDRVADLGAGGGYFTFRLAEAVGESGRVYAVDVDDDMVDYLTQQARERGAANVAVVRGEFEDPKLPDGEIDLLFTCNTYHHIADRSAYFRRVLVDLAPSGRVAIVEFDGRGGWFAAHLRALHARRRDRARDARGRVRADREARVPAAPELPDLPRRRRHRGVIAGYRSRSRSSARR